jgi:ABC-2 type transport system permease protein
MMRRAGAFRTELIGLAGIIERNAYLVKRYALWEVAFFLWTVANTDDRLHRGRGRGGGRAARREPTDHGAAHRSGYMGLPGDHLRDPDRDRGVGAVGGDDRVHVHGTPVARRSPRSMGVFAVAYGVVRAGLLFGVIAFFFDLEMPDANFVAALVVLAVASISFVGIGMMTAVLPLISPEKGTQLAFIAQGLLLVVSGIYYSVEILPEPMQWLSVVSPATYALDGIRAAILEGVGTGDLWSDLVPLGVIGVVSIPLGLGIFRVGERYAKQHGKLKRSG